MNVPIGERLVDPTASIPSNEGSSSDSGSLSQSSSSSSDSSPGPRQTVRRLARRVISSDPGQGVTSTTAPEFPALRVPPDASLTQAVTTSVFHRNQVQTDEAAASGASPVIVRTSRAQHWLSCAQQGRISPETSPRGAPVRTFDDRSPLSRPATPAESSRVDWTPRESGFDWVPIETDSWGKFEEVAQHAARGAARKVVDYAVDAMGLLRTKIDDQIEQQTKTLQAARNSEEFHQPGQIENLMGQARYLWERNAELKKKIATLEAEQQELEVQQTQAAGEIRQLRGRIGELQEEWGKLQRQLEEARAPPPPTGPDVQKTASQGSCNTETRISQLQQDCEWIGGERGSPLEPSARIASHQRRARQKPGTS